MTYKARKRLALFVLVVGLPAYVVLAVTLMSEASRFHKVVEFVIYVVLGIGWVFPLKWVFMGIGQSDPDE
ncbi:DUF2842 domain-containing protein [Yoonia sediminilitoris]|uniref:Uncharacterized protein DUF2842 n=1 Tax=Yoonia sediminilitoris TaxID=1286148 RepID=A0A2T6KEX4_9RHOB|nr:DUF2842 domain-containing protein [Yoonia sediminilitoris]PUB13671.1 uncharacterized protein DUF2842 [Yoonia sediminilitoris]RCW94841.1 uncharacterized protein DUF2842 [Yoonia sediminilitoris]